MPQTIETGAFAFGAILLLLALVSGGFKIFGAEVSGAANTLGRVLAFVLGLSLIGLAVYVSNPAVRKPDVAPAEPKQQTSTTPRTQAGIAGTWADPTGTLFRITPTGNGVFSFVAVNRQSGLQSQGTVTTRGDQLISTFRTNIPSTGGGTGTLSADGLRLTGDFRDSVVGSYSMTLYRQE